MRNEQKVFIDNVKSINEWVSIIKELQGFIKDNEFISLHIGNDYIMIDENKITLNGLSFSLFDFTFTDFEKIYLAFSEYINK